MIFEVEITKRAKRQLSKAPQHVVAKLAAWIQDVEVRGLESVRKQPGYHDHPLKGKLVGMRAISLSRKWRGVYEEINRSDGIVTIDIAELQEVHPHDY